MPWPLGTVAGVAAGSGGATWVAVSVAGTWVVDWVALIWVADSAGPISAAALAGAISAMLAGLSAGALRVSGSPGCMATSTTIEVSVAAWVSRPAIMTTGATATPITIPTAVTRPATDVRQHQRPAT